MLYAIYRRYCTFFFLIHVGSASRSSDDRISFCSKDPILPEASSSLALTAPQILKTLRMLCAMLLVPGGTLLVDLQNDYVSYYIDEYTP